MIKLNSIIVNQGFKDETYLFYQIELSLIQRTIFLSGSSHNYPWQKRVPSQPTRPFPSLSLWCNVRKLFWGDDRCRHSCYVKCVSVFWENLLPQLHKQYPFRAGACPWAASSWLEGWRLPGCLLPWVWTGAVGRALSGKPAHAHSPAVPTQRWFPKGCILLITWSDL